ncbi:intermembrane transport protein PqiB [Ferrimonas marina]|nr:intermembrane transport protein PqiB [Ferrimonas marina]
MDSKSVKRNRIATIWLIPVIAVLIGLWMVLSFWLRQGPMIELTVANAEGLEAGKTKIRLQSVEIGTIKTIALDKELRGAVIQARINKEAREALVEDSLFWVVKPRVGRSGVSGLSTLFSGAYIELKPGTSRRERRNFELQETPPVAGPDTPGTRIELMSFRRLSVGEGTSIRYRGFEVGKIESVTYLPDQDQVRSQAFIFSPFDDLINQQSRFWQVPGLEVSLSSAGLNMSMESLDSLINGSITFGLPEGVKAGGPIQDEHSFTLFADRQAMEDSRLEHDLEYVLLFNQSVAGLMQGSPVTYRGIQIGEVEEVPCRALTEIDAVTDSGAIPVLIVIQLDRFESDLDASFSEAWRSKFDKWVQNGLRATLGTSNLLTGAKAITFAFEDEPTDVSEQVALGEILPYPIIPTVENDFGALASNLNAVLEKIAELPMEPLLLNTNQLVADLDKTVNALTVTAGEVNGLLSETQQEQLIPELRNTLTQLNETLAGLEPNAPIYHQLEQSLAELNRLMNQMEPLMHSLGRKPDALVWGEDALPDPEIEVSP